ncbi:hypothetical protein [Rugamonas aquatica]|uniref:Uncharacterized protein n=1 Tax=Rugamonas aquatica TaxID=2743357 RepID=A0A6A7N698_9BURK|nr:hypothetical protein [Rugamonas aquatica]MQA40655.1 hypothetical protein [Rugamonas aquatica]
MTTGVTFPIEYTLKNIHTPKADQYISNFFANNGRIMMTPDNKSFYKSDGHVNGLEKNGTIYIGTQSVDNYAKKMEIPPTWAARDLAIHELGHVAYQQRDYEQNPGDSAPMSAKVDWCMTREAEATFFSFTVAMENHAQGGNLHVPGTDAVPDLYNAMLSALAGTDARSSLYEKKGIDFAKDIFAHDSKYVAYCSDPNNWKKPAYVTPTDTSGSDGGNGGGGGGGGGGGTGGYTPQPGGYWREVPPDNPSDSVAPVPQGHDAIQLVGVSPHSGHFEHAAL